MVTAIVALWLIVGGTILAFGAELMSKDVTAEYPASVRLLAYIGFIVFVWPIAAILVLKARYL